MLVNQKLRSDSWTQEDEQTLSDVILKSIADGMTQLMGFKAAALALSRTPRACAFRWNALVRHRLYQEIEDAKQAGRMKRGERWTTQKQVKYKHFKGGIYSLLHIGKHSETQEMLVIYQGDDGQVWVRPYEMFYDLVKLPDGTAVQRFTPIII